MSVPISLLVLGTLAACPLAAWLGRRGPGWAASLAAWPSFVAFSIAEGMRSALSGQISEDELDWIPSIGLKLAFRLDGLSALFAFLISAIGALIVVYAAFYLQRHPHAGRFQATLFAFMAAMLGVVSTDNVFALFVFWELTGFTSYLLIGFDHEERASRRAALQALLVTGAGGLALLAAGALLSQAAGTVRLSELVERGQLIRQHPAYTASVLCVLFAAFTKSAQFPFHFWLPNAMAAPTPVSAYLHSATMVKAGIYLVARLTPALGGTPLWVALISAVAGITLLGGAFQALAQTDLKKILAYSTVSALGTLMLLLGLGTAASVTAAIVYLVAHAAYKGSLFMVAGIIDHATGTRDVTQLGGLRKLMPITAGIAALAAASMAGLPPLLGFLAKEQMYAATLAQPLVPVVLVVALVLESAWIGAAGLAAGVAPFVGRRLAPEGVHEASPGLWLNPLLLAVLGLAGWFTGILGPIVNLAASSAFGQTVHGELVLWHGFSLPLLLSAATLLLVMLAYSQRARLRRWSWPAALRTERLYDAVLSAVHAVSARSAPPLQDATLTAYVLAFVVSAGALLFVGLFASTGIPVPRPILPPLAHEVLIVAMIVGMALNAAWARTTMTGVFSLGAAGYGVALMFLLYGAPDLAMTQFAVETLTAVIFVFVFWQLPRTEERTSRSVKVRDAAIAIAFGCVVSVLTLASATHPTNSRLRDFFAKAAPTEAHGRNIVNVILVDFRALDTLGEITVLATAAVGVSALLRIAAAQRQRR
jgi:multicomponent Na+:H+ antiporter subunit A